MLATLLGSARIDAIRTRLAEAAGEGPDLDFEAQLEPDPPGCSTDQRRRGIRQIPEAVGLFLALTMMERRLTAIWLRCDSWIQRSSLTRSRIAQTSRSSGSASGRHHVDASLGPTSGHLPRARRISPPAIGASTRRRKNKLRRPWRATRHPAAPWQVDGAPWYTNVSRIRRG